MYSKSSHACLIQFVCGHQDPTDASCTSQYTIYASPKNYQHLIFLPASPKQKGRQCKQSTRIHYPLSTNFIQFHIFFSGWYDIMNIYKPSIHMAAIALPTAQADLQELQEPTTATGAPTRIGPVLRKPCVRLEPACHGHG